jgi:hypothetical protein
MQTDYNDPVALVAGMITPGGTTEIQSRIAEDAVEFGTAVVRGTNLKRGVAKPTADTEEFMGFVAFNQNVSGNIAVDDDVSLVTKGSVAMTVVAAVTVAPGEPAYVVASGADAGKVTNVSTSNIATGAVFGSAKVNDDLATVRIDLAK